MQRESFLTRTVIEPYRNGPSFVLTMWDATWNDRGGLPRSNVMPQHPCGYMLVQRGRGVIFTGEDYGCSPMHAIDSEDCVRGLLGFLCLRPGDTDAEYFETYTEDQLVFAAEHGETLSLYTLDDDPVPFNSFEVL